MLMIQTSVNLMIYEYDEVLLLLRTVM